MLYFDSLLKSLLFFFPREIRFHRCLKSSNPDGILHPDWKPPGLFLPSSPTGKIPPTFQAQLKSTFLYSLTQYYYWNPLFHLYYFTLIYCFATDFPEYAFHSRYPCVYTHLLEYTSLDAQQKVWQIELKEDFFKMLKLKLRIDLWNHHKLSSF